MAGALHTFQRHNIYYSALQKDFRENLLYKLMKDKTR